MLQGVFPLKTFYWGQKGARDNYLPQIRKMDTVFLEKILS